MKSLINVRLKALLSGLVLMLFTGMLCADEDLAPEEDLFTLDLEQLMQQTVHSPGKFKQAAAQAAAVISIISRQEIERFGANNLLEVLDRSTSMAMTGSFFFMQNTASMRGDFGSHADNHVLLLLNGRPMRDSFTGGENFSIYTAFPLDIIKQIEIIRGPGSVLYGSNAFSGVINIITQNGKEIDNQLNATIGSFATRSIEASGGYSDGDFNLSGGAKYFKENGWQFAALDNAGVPGQFDAGEDNYSLVLNGNDQNLSFNLALTRSLQDFWGARSVWAGSVPQSARDIESKRAMVDVGYLHKFNQQRYLDVNVSYAQANFSHFNYDSQSKNSFAEISHHWDFSDNLRWLIGTTLWHQNISSEAGLRAAPTPDVSQNWWSLYSQVNYDMNANLSWVVGAQINKVPQISANTVPRVGFVYQLDDASGFKLMHGKAFRAAYGAETHFELTFCCRPNGTSRGGLRGNLELKPETVSTTDLQYYRYGQSYQFNGTVFASHQHDLIDRERTDDGTLQFVNRGNLDSHGVELELKYQLGDDANSGGQIIASYSYQSNKSWRQGPNESEGSTVHNLTLQPNHMAKIGYSNHFENGISIGVFDSWFDHNHDNIVRSPRRQEVNPPASSYHMMSANIRIPLTALNPRLSDQAAIEIYGYNLLDEAIYQPEVAGRLINTNPLRGGRSVYLSLVMGF